MKSILVITIGLCLLFSCAMDRTSATGWDYGGNSTNGDAYSNGSSKTIIRSSTLHISVKNPDSALVQIPEIA